MSDSPHARSSPESVTVLFCGAGGLAGRILHHLRDNGGEVVALGANPPADGETPRELIAAAGVDDDAVFYGRSFADPLALRRFTATRPDLGVCCGFSSVLPGELLRLPRLGWVNVHRSLLPYNRGLDPLRWALIDRTPAGVSLHVMTEAVDAGPVIGQREVPVTATDDIQSLSARADEHAFELFCACWPRLRRGDLAATPQEEDLATVHTWQDCEAVRCLDLNERMTVRRLLAILRSYSTADLPAYFQIAPAGERYAVRISIDRLGDD